MRRAIEQLEGALSEYGSIFALGSPIHNPQEVKRLVDMGLEVVEDISKIPEGSVAFIRAHGVSRAELEEVGRKCRVVVDGTCPYVRNVQRKAERLEEEGYRVVIVGDSRHPEVKGIFGHIGPDAVVMNGGDDVKPESRRSKIGILCQTTQREETLALVASKFIINTDEVRVYNTVCGATIERQSSIRRLAASVDGIVIIGGKNSANTRELVEISESLGVPALWVEQAEELNRRWLRERRTIGVAAGGSTPDWLLEEIVRKLKRL
ncbi:MAG: 4-hydroxy-3-methylbut-2-enyl diphosphate reductase [Synergistaceae bacterium]|nr:4-hydroxy-3-methylbut-2-enyl diphosphate reductase [Synergistaceae bacterium]